MPSLQLQRVARQHLASVLRDEDDLLDTYPLAISVRTRLERTDHPRLEHGGAARHDSRLLVPVGAKPVTRVVRVAEPLPGDRIEVARDRSRANGVEHPMQPLARDLMVVDRAG